MCEADKDFIRVAVGVILRDGQVCISLRPDHLHKGGYWEFPGGKIEAGEAVESALERELIEELGIKPTQIEPFEIIEWHYPDKSVRLEVLKVLDFEGEPKGLEAQEVRWVAIQQLSEYQFPEANEVIVSRLLGILAT